MRRTDRSRTSWSRIRYCLLAWAGALPVLASCSDPPESQPAQDQARCNRSAVECALAVALDSMAAERGRPSLLFVDTSIKFGPGVDPRTMRFSPDELASELEWLRTKFPSLREDTRTAFLSANTPPRQYPVIPSVRSRIMSLGDSSSMVLYSQRRAEKGLESSLVDAARVSYVEPGLSRDGEQALVFIEWAQAAFSGTSQYLLLEKERNGTWRVVASVEVSVS